jgi:hypothetical protein
MSPIQIEVVKHQDDDSVRVLEVRGYTFTMGGAVAVSQSFELVDVDDDEDTLRILREAEEDRRNGLTTPGNSLRRKAE